MNITMVWSLKQNESKKNVSIYLIDGHSNVEHSYQEHHPEVEMERSSEMCEKQMCFKHRRKRNILFQRNYEWLCFCKVSGRDSKTIGF